MLQEKATRHRGGGGSGGSTSLAALAFFFLEKREKKQDGLLSLGYSVLRPPSAHHLSLPNKNRLLLQSLHTRYEPCLPQQAILSVILSPYSVPHPPYPVLDPPQRKPTPESRHLKVAQKRKSPERWSFLVYLYLPRYLFFSFPSLPLSFRSAHSEIAIVMAIRPPRP